MLGDAKTVINRRIAAGGVKPRGRAQIGGRDSGEFLALLGAVALLGTEGGPVLELVPVAAFAHEFLVDETLGDDHMRHRRHDGDVCAGLQRQMIIGLDMRRAHQVDAARIDDDQLGALAQTRLHARAENRVSVGRVGADDDDHIGFVDGIEILCSCRCAEGLVEAVAGRRMADARASVGVVIAEAGAGQLLHQIAFLVGAARGGDDADRILAVFGLDFLEAAGGEADRLVPGHDAPGLMNGIADHRLQQTLAVGRVAISEAALDAAVAVIGLAVLPGSHAHDFLAAHLRLEGAADAAIGASGHGRVFGLADLDHRFLGQRRGRAGLNASAAGDAFGFEKGFRHARRHAAVEASAANRQREGALDLFAGAHAAIANDALRRIIGEIGVRLVLRHPFEIGRAVVAREDMIGAVVAVAHLAQPNRARHVLQFAVSIGGAGQAVQRMVGDVKLHHAAPDRLEARRLGIHGNARHDRRCAGRRRAVASLDLDQAKPARAERLDAVGRAEFRDFRPDLHRRAHDRRALGHGDALSVDRQRNEFRRLRLWCSVIDFLDQAHAQYLTRRRLQGPACGSLRGSDAMRFRPGRARSLPARRVNQVSSSGKGL